MAVSLPQIYGDERDSIIAKWNQLQAYWGTGKGYSKNGEVELKPDNPYCRFKVSSKLSMDIFKELVSNLDFFVSTFPFKMQATCKIN